MKKIIASLAAALIMTAVPSAHSGVSAENESKVKVMCIGDSITDGYWTQGGYRKYLSMQLDEMGYSNIDLVGPKGNDQETFNYDGKEVAYDGNYAGYSGYAIQYMDGKELRQGILETLTDGDYIKKYSPDIVLLQIGTNDLLSDYNDGITDRLENLINYILDNGTSGELVYVTTVPDIDTAKVSDWLWAYGEKKWNSTPEEFSKLVQDCVDKYNASISELVKKMQNEGKNVRFADIHSVVDMNDDLYDGVHPNESGYEKMGNYWAKTLDSYFKNEAPGTETDKTDMNEIVKGLDAYILGIKDHGITDANWKSYDINNDSQLDAFDLVEARKLLAAKK